MKTEEVEALLSKFYAASHKEFSGDAVRAGVEAVARAVRAQDAARGGPLTGTQVTLALADVSSRIGPMQAVVLHEHMSAQGRANAALTQEKDILKQGLEMVRAQGQHLSGLVTTLTQDRDRLLAQRQADGRAIHDALVWAHGWHGKTLPSPSRDVAELLREYEKARAELAKAQERIAELAAKADRSENRRGWARSEALAANAAANTATTDMQSAWTRTAIAEQRANRAESALDTLRKAVVPFYAMAELLSDMHKDNDGTLCVRRTPIDSVMNHELTVTHCRALVSAFDSAFDATPAEHPDTDTLRAIRERANDADALGRAAAEGVAIGRWDATTDADDRDAYREMGESVAEYLLGDSSPSGGGDAPQCSDGYHLWPDDGDGVCLCGVQTRTRIMDALLVVTPTTPPDVAASEPTPEEDWRTVEEALRHNLSDAEEFSGPRAIGDAKRALAALARLKAEPRRAAEAMRERCAKVAQNCQCAGDSPGWRAAQAEIEETIRALPLD